MKKITTIQEATKYLHKLIQETNPEVQEEEIFETLLEEVLESSDVELTREEVETLDEHTDDLVFIDHFLQKKIPNYQEMIGDIVEDMVNGDDDDEE